MHTLDDLVVAVLELPPSELTAELSRTGNAAWSSMRHVQLIVSVEEQYGVSFTAQEMASVNTLDDLRRMVADKHAGR
ncbi:acyl carrier protein [Micromonospora sp. NPDC049051]|uniref:acyl carrier protein n=1 Tax=Micromonospora sp. NPDC049051 TaxID=3364264 RepID=UPI00372148E9